MATRLFNNILTLEKNMFNLGRLAVISALLSLSAVNSLTAFDEWECCEEPSCSRVYIGGFGGGIYSNATTVSQMGTAYFFEDEGGALSIYAKGKTKSTSSGFGGAQIGYESYKWLGCSDWSLGTAGEVEAFFFSHNKEGHLINPPSRLVSVPFSEHDFDASFRMNMGVYLVNVVFSLNNPSLCGFSPYIGGGVGATRISIRNAESAQVDPLEPGVNHFNSDRGDSSWAFAAQAKAGLRYNFCDSFHLFGEYRYVYVDTSNYILGATVYPTHAATSPWNVRIKNMQYNAFAFGLQYDL